MSSAHLSTTTDRRTMLRTGAGAMALTGLLTGCGVDAPDLPGSEDEVDLPAAREAARLTRRLVTRIEAATAAHPHLTTGLAGVLALHEQHLDALAGVTTEPPPSSTPPRAHRDRATALAALARAERRTRQRLVALAQQADSGELALLFGSMAAAIGQRLEEWPA